MSDEIDAVAIHVHEAARLLRTADDLVFSRDEDNHWDAVALSIMAQTHATLALQEQIDSVFIDALKVFSEYTRPDVQAQQIKHMVEVFTHLEGADIGNLFETNVLFKAAVIAWKEYEARVVEENRTSSCVACHTILDLCMEQRRLGEDGCCDKCEHVVLP